MSLKPMEKVIAKAKRCPNLVSGEYGEEICKIANAGTDEAQCPKEPSLDCCCAFCSDFDRCCEHCPELSFPDEPFPHEAAA